VPFRLNAPTGHGEVVTHPSFAAWAEQARANARAAAAWDFSVAGAPATELRRRARREAVAAAARFSERLGVPVAPAPAEPDLVVVTGHQPELFHPGIWVKHFLLQRLAEETGATALDLVVDSDGFSSLGVEVPSMRPVLARRSIYLAVGEPDGCYATAPVPPPERIREFREAGLAALWTLPAPAIGRHFDQFCAEIEGAARDASNLAEVVVLARRRYEASAGTTYLELPITAEASGGAFRAFFVDLALRAERVRDAYNGALHTYRARKKMRSLAQPFPDLARDGDLIELPFWTLVNGTRKSVWARSSDVVEIRVEDQVFVRLPRDPEAAAAALEAAPMRLAPKAATLTMYNRLFVADLFVHGIGGARYDRVTDAIAEALYGVEPLPFAVASMTMYLPIGARVVTSGEIEEAERRLDRFTHNPDDFLDEVDFASAGERKRAFELAEEKERLVEALGRPGADKRSLGARVREINREMGELLAPLREELREEIQHLRERRNAADVLTDRTYPFCFWDPREIQDKAR
jgi:hypothetical protein